jgi:tryptophan synthase beta chain
MPLILELEQAEYGRAKDDPSFWARWTISGPTMSAGPRPLYFAPRLTEELGGAKIYMKRDELNHTGAHKINNVLGQILLARRMGKTASSPRPAPASTAWRPPPSARKFGLQCVVFMGATDVERQKPNVFRMKLLGAEVIPVTSGRATLKDAMNEALRDWVDQCRRHLLLHRHGGGPAPLSGDGARLPVDHRQGGARADPGAGRPAARRAGRLHRRRLERHGPVPPVPRRQGRADHRRRGRRPRRRRPDGARGQPHRRAPGVLHGNRTYLLQDEDGQILEGTRSRPASTIPASARSIPGCTTSAGWNTSRRPTCRGAGRLPAVLPHRRHHPGAGAEPRARPCHRSRRPAEGRPS